MTVDPFHVKLCLFCVSFPYVQTPSTNYRLGRQAPVVVCDATSLAAVKGRHGMPRR